ncbi:DUF397 domain-containing protein [Streptomyces sp. NPDC058045]|uniref:DUF397 domain-containing protein n=1 Tax=Streptomyces sp. NPDC058045 TaxID=3346311 RepID=UPI0036E10C88
MTEHSRTAHLSAGDLTGATWFKSSHSDGAAQCIEVADLRATSYRAVAVRDSKDPNGPAFLVEPAVFAGFTAFAADFEV